jgi:hypothetical protein
MGSLEAAERPIMPHIMPPLDGLAVVEPVVCPPHI